VVHGDALEVIPKLSGKFDFIFIDAEKSEYLQYLKLAENRISKNCVVVADNVKIFKNTLGDYLNHVRNPKNYKSKTYDLGFDAIEVSVKK
jgi:predicted O-methyltransferase YrrM